LRKNNKEIFALSGGEDYQFLFTFPKHKLATVQRITMQGHPISIIGEVIRGKGVKVLSKGKVLEIPVKGYEHFGNPQ
jgi:thiamine-monophosphate kinase